MRRSGASSLKLGAVLAVAILGTPTQVRADVILHDSDGWTFYTAGLVAAHYQLTTGDTDPATEHGVLVGGLLLPVGSNDPRTGKITSSRFRSGFVGTQIGFGVNRKISDRTRVQSFLAASVNDISSNRNQEHPKGVDYREAWAALVTPGGTLKFGRMFSIFGSASSPVVLLAYRYGIGQPCVLDAPTIACGSVGAGPLYAGFDAQMRYITPRIAGLEFQLSLSDPAVGPSYKMTPFPRVDVELNFDRQFGSNNRGRVIAQGIGMEVQRVDNVPRMNDPAIVDKVLKRGRVLGGMLSAILDVGGLSVGGGGFQCAGCGTHTVMEIGDAANPLAYDSSGEMRHTRGFFGNAKFDYRGTAIAAGGGTTFMRVTAGDVGPGGNISLIKQTLEWHIVLTHKIDTVVLTAEFMQWKNKWHYGEKQALIFSGVGANYYW